MLDCLFICVVLACLCLASLYLFASRLLYASVVASCCVHLFVFACIIVFVFVCVTAFVRVMAVFLFLLCLPKHQVYAVHIYVIFIYRYTLY